MQQQLQYVNVGVHLQIAPFVSRLGYVTSVVLVEVSNVTAFIQGNIPQISQRQAIATVRVRDNQPFIIGGLLQNNEIVSLSKVPLLSSIPILGALFDYQNRTHQQTNLYVVITPHVVFIGASETAGYGLRPGHPIVLRRVVSPSSTDATVVFVSQFDAEVPAPSGALTEWLMTLTSKMPLLIVAAPLLSEFGMHAPTLAANQTAFYQRLTMAAAATDASLSIMSLPKGPRTYLLRDGLHPNERGQMFIARLVERWLASRGLCRQFRSQR